MELSAEAIIGLVTLFVTCSPTALLVYSWFSRRNGGSQGRGLTSQHSLSNTGRSPNTHTGVTPQDSQVQQRGSVQSIPRYPIEGTSPQLGKALLRNYVPKASFLKNPDPRVRILSEQARETKLRAFETTNRLTQADLTNIELGTQTQPVSTLASAR
ncbi:hypothetical protein V491_05048 [Pseudogymnoascus sp. VKM F-3775]|nr:hypothetical protein V491_05048 [Pseudogymnoascus sp. VKM F-3775]